MQNDSNDTSPAQPFYLFEYKGCGYAYHYALGEFISIEQQNAADSFQPRSPFKCGACRGTTTVGADGTLYPCHRFVGMDKWIIGSISNGPDYEKSKQFWCDYAKCVMETCSDCWAYPLCKGPCPWECAREDGTFALNEHSCEVTIRWIMQGAWFKTLYAKTMKGVIA